MIIIPTIYKNLPLLDACLKSVYAHTPNDIPVYLADNPTYSFAQNCNMGIAAASPDTKIVVFLNDDTEVTDGWYETLLAPFQDPLVNIVGCRLIYPDSRLQHAGVYLDFVDGVLTAHNHLTEQPSGPVEAVTGACMAVRSEFAHFDEAFVNGYEDIDLCLRTKGVYYTNSTTVIHHESQSGPRRWMAVGSNIELLHYRYGRG